MCMKSSYICPTVQKLLSKTSGYMRQLCESNFNTKVSDTSVPVLRQRLAFDVGLLILI